MLIYFCRGITLYIQANKTVTYLDLRSNSLGDKGLLALTPFAGSSSAVLDLLDLRSNSVGQDAAIRFSEGLANTGSQLRVRFDSAVGRANYGHGPPLRNIIISSSSSSSTPIYSYPHQVSSSTAKCCLAPR